MDWKRYEEMAEKFMEEENWIPIWTNFGQELTDIICPLIFKAKQKGKKEIRFLIDSSGGLVTSVVSIGNTLKLCGLPSVGLVLGRAYSGGFFTLQYCDQRLAVDGAFLMPHWGSYPLDNASIGVIANGDTWPIDDLRSYTDFLINQTHLRSGVPLGELRTLFLQERKFTARSALDMKFIDKVIYKPDPKLSELSTKAKAVSEEK